MKRIWLIWALWSPWQCHEEGWVPSSQNYYKNELIARKVVWTTYKRPMNDLQASFSIKRHMDDFSHYSPLWAYFYFSVGLAQPWLFIFYRSIRYFSCIFCCCKGLIFFVDINFCIWYFFKEKDRIIFAEVPLDLRLLTKCGPVVWHSSCNFNSSSLCPSILTSINYFENPKSHLSFIGQSYVNHKSL